MNRLGDVVRLLMERRELNGNQLAAEIGISPTSVSKIVTGHSKPRQLTLTQLIQRLCRNADEEQMIIRAYTGLADILPDEPEEPPRPIPDDELDRVTRYMEVKSMSVAFENDVEAVLKGMGISYEKDFCVSPLICDFLLDLGNSRVAIDCKYNVNRDWDRTIAAVKLLKEGMPCSEVLIVIPYENDLARNARQDLIQYGGCLTPLEHLREYLNSPKT